MSREAEANGIYQAGLQRVKDTPEPEGQKFPIGTRVYIQKDLGEPMWHFTSGVWGTVEYTYGHAFHGDDVDSYSIDIDDHGSVAWYAESELHLEVPENEAPKRPKPEFWQKFDADIGAGYMKEFFAKETPE